MHVNVLGAPLTMLVYAGLDKLTDVLCAHVGQTQLRAAKALLIATDNSDSLPYTGCYLAARELC